MVNTAVDTIAGGIADDIRADYLACYEGDRFVESMRYARRYPEELPVLAGLLPQITVPVTIINGRHDRVVPLSNAEFLDRRLPASRLVIIDAGHFVWEEESAKYASAILDSVTGNRWLPKGARDDSGVPHAAGRPQRQGCAQRGHRRAAQEPSGTGASARPGEPARRTGIRPGDQGRGAGERRPRVLHPARRPHQVAEYTAEAAKAGRPGDASLGMLWHKLSELPVVTIAKIRGRARGAGSELALACELVISDAAQDRTAALFAQGLQTRGPLELDLGDRLGALQQIPRRWPRRPGLARVLTAH